MNTAPENEALVAAIDAILPQTQCTKCGYEGCRPYAEAMAAGDADINRCPPGGEAGIQQLARFLGRPYKPLDPANGVEKRRAVAIIDTEQCIDCTLCIRACPVDAIIGASKQLHTVVTSLCSGCELCVAPCPVDCIVMVPAVGEDERWDQPRRDAARERHDARRARLARERESRVARLAERSMSPDDAEGKRSTVLAAVLRAKAKGAPGDATTDPRAILSRNALGERLEPK